MNILLWFGEVHGDFPPPTAPGELLLEDGYYLQLEDGGFFELEG